MLDQDIKQAVSAAEAYMIDIRRALHQIPEPGFQEFETQAYIRRKLDELHIPYQTERTWIIGLIEGAQPGKTVALRADMDALPLTEQANLPFCSRKPGMMHACGHDAHCAMLLGAAKVLSEHRDAFAGQVKLLFQPAEETDGGAVPMIAAGCMEHPHIDYAFGLHVMPHLPVGVMETRVGALNASTDEVQICVRGKSGHGAHPESGADAIVCAAQLVVALQTLISRNTPPVQPAALHFGKIEGGVARNIICDCVTLTGTLRTADPNLRALLKRRIRELAGSLCQAMGCQAEVTLTPGYCVLMNHADEARLVMRIAERLYGAHAVVERDAPSMGADDFGCFIEQTPGAYVHIGCANPARMPAQPLHSASFLLDERCLAFGATLEVALVNELLGV